MSSRIGIELSQLAWRIVELDGDVPDTRVRSFAVLEPHSPEASAAFGALGRAAVAAIVWGVPNSHRQFIVDCRDHSRMQREAIAAAADAGVQTSGMAADIALAGASVDGSHRQPVLLTLAASADLEAAIQPLRDAGLRVRSVGTPANALMSLARTRRAFITPGAIEMYVALEEESTAVALVRDAVVLAATDLSWGYLKYASRSDDSALRDQLALRLAHDLSEFLATVGATPAVVAHLLICGGLPELRSMTVPLMERLDVEVETLDSLIGIDAANLPEPNEEFREKAAELRLAWAAAADWPTAINLVRPRPPAARRIITRAAITAGIIGGIALGWRIQRGMSDTQPRQAASTVRPADAPRATPPPVPAPKSAPAAAPSTPVKPAPTPSTVPVRPAPPVAVPSAPARALIPPPPPPIAPTNPVPQRPAPIAPIVRSAPPQAVQRPPSPAPSPNPPLRAARPAPEPRAVPLPEAPLPFDASLQAVLVSADRRLAIIDGRIVSAGDDVRGARIVEITSTAVFLRDAQGRPRVLTLGRSGQ